MSNVPKLRFKEFSGKWVEKPLGKYGKLINGLTYSPDNIVENGLLVLRSSNIQNEQISFEDNVYVNLNVEDEYLTCENDILICVRNGSKRLIGKSLLISRNLPKSTHGAFMTVFRGDSNKFISHWLKTPMFFKEVHKNLGATINSINGSNLKKFKTFFPNSKEEQEKIASFLTSVDTKIEQLTKKEQLLQQYKKGVMQKIFNQEIRFKADDGSEFCDWEEKKLGDILDYIQPTKYLVKDTEYNDSYTIPVLTAGKTFILGYTNETDGVFENNLPVIIFDDFTTANKFVNFPFKAKSSAMKILVSKNNNIKFIYEAIQMIKYEVGGHERHWISKFSFLNIFIPCIEEQTKIANFLSSIDSKIEKVKKQLNSTKEFKKALLQQMFV